ncbi:hypothetical protein [Clostridium sporogenes]|uniref:hypothetical protein n=1 Tax=Clostridium sporogenes TaxID=1509 RepID=UPI00223EF078|nr:hypothetical protein [Clostridium sporogenes]
MPKPPKPLPLQQNNSISTIIQINELPKPNPSPGPQPGILQSLSFVTPFNKPAMSLKSTLHPPFKG